MNVVLGLFIMLAIAFGMGLAAKTIFTRLAKNGKVDLVIWLGSFMTGLAVCFLVYSYIKASESEQFAMSNIRYKQVASENTEVARMAQAQAEESRAEAQRQAAIAETSRQEAERIQKLLENCN